MGSTPVGIVRITVLVAVAMTVTVPENWLATYTTLPSGEMASPRLSLPLPTGMTVIGTLVEVLKTVTCPTSRFVAYIRRPSGVTMTAFALLGNGAVAMTELL